MSAKISLICTFWEIILNALCFSWDKYCHTRYTIQYDKRREGLQVPKLHFKKNSIGLLGRTKGGKCFPCSLKETLLVLCPRIWACIRIRQIACAYYMYAIYICDCILENRPYGHKYWNPFFACRGKPHSCTIQRHQALETRWPGLLLQAAFFRRCKTTRVPFPEGKGTPQGNLCGPWGALIRLHGLPNWSWRQAWPTQWVVLVWVTYWWQTSALWVWMFALPHLRLPTRPHRPPHPPPPPTPPPYHPPTPYRLNSCYYKSWKNHLKNQGHPNS